jgi:hypothetical protein
VGAAAILKAGARPEAVDFTRVSAPFAFAKHLRLSYNNTYFFVDSELSLARSFLILKEARINSIQTHINKQPQHSDSNARRPQSSN